jgi:hypothetical protein
VDCRSYKKKVRKDLSVTLIGLSNNKQYQFNCELDDVLDSIDKAFSLRHAGKTHEYISEAKHLIKRRIKPIRILLTILLPVWAPFKSMRN